MKLHFKLHNLNGLIIVFTLIIACLGLSYILLHNPYKELHTQILATSDMVRSYYRDQPGYWKLTTEFAQENGLIKIDMSKFKDSELSIGHGPDGDIVMPGEMSFDITLKRLNKSACIGLSEMPVSQNTQLGVQKITINDIEFTWGGEYALPVGKYKTRNICKQTDNTIVWTFN